MKKVGMIFDHSDFLVYIKQKDSSNIDFKDFVINAIANLISNNTDGLK